MSETTLPATETALPALSLEIVRAEAITANRIAWDKAAAEGASAEAMLEYGRRDLQLKGKVPDGLPAPPSDEPKPSDDPSEALIGLTAPQGADPEALVQRFEMRGETLTDEGRGVARAIATILPSELHAEGEQLIRDVWSMEATAAHERWTEDRAILELDPADVALYLIMVDQLPAAQVRYLQARHLHVYPLAIERIARAAEKWLGTDAGIRWTLKEGGAAKRLALERQAGQAYLRVAREQGVDVGE